MKLSHICKDNYADKRSGEGRFTDMKHCYITNYNRFYHGILHLTALKSMQLYGIIIFTLMPNDPTPKRKALQTTGTFNSRAPQVRHSLFQQSSFFDPEDLLQLKYETLRAMEIEKYPIAKAARDFGLSRPTIYEAKAQMHQQGLEGLLPHKRGPKAAHKLTGQVLQFLQEQVKAEPQITAEELARQVRLRFAVKLHPRTIQKALEQKVKRGRLI